MINNVWHRVRRCIPQCIREIVSRRTRGAKSSGGAGPSRFNSGGAGGIAKQRDERGLAKRAARARFASSDSLAGTGCQRHCGSADTTESGTAGRVLSVSGIARRLSRRESRKESGEQPGLRFLCTRGPRSSESDTEPPVLRQPIAMTGRRWTVKTTAGAVRIGKSRDCPDAPATLFEKLLRNGLPRNRNPKSRRFDGKLRWIAN